MAKTKEKKAEEKPKAKKKAPVKLGASIQKLCESKEAQDNPRVSKYLKLAMREAKAAGV